MSVDFYEQPSSLNSSRSSFLLSAICASQLNPVRGFQVEVAHESVRAGFLTTISRSYWVNTHVGWNFMRRRAGPELTQYNDRSIAGVWRILKHRYKYLSRVYLDRIVHCCWTIAIHCWFMLHAKTTRSQNFAYHDVNNSRKKKMHFSSLSYHCNWKFSFYPFKSVTCFIFKKHNIISNYFLNFCDFNS